MNNDNNKCSFFNTGFTLIELIIMLAILGLIATIVTTRITDISSSVRVSSAMSQISSDIELVKEMSLAKHQSMSITFDIHLERYTIRKGNNIVSDYPGSDNGSINLSEGTLTGIDITNVNINGSNRINFDKWGNVLNHGTITLNSNHVISVDKLTGFTKSNNQ